MVINNPQNMIATYVWTIDGEVIATGVNPTVELPLGVHKILLTITDSQGNVVTDEVVIQVISDTGIWLESECGNLGSWWNIEQDDNASMGEYVTIQPDNNSLEAAPSDVAGLLTYEFDVSNSGTYTLYTRIICPTANDDSFWLKMDSGPFVRWNNIQPSTAWTPIFLRIKAIDC